MCFDVRTSPFVSYLERLRTFNCWSRIQTPDSLARVGFFRTGGLDEVQCFYCGIRIFDWEPHDDPLSEHLRWSSDCVFANLLQHIQTAEEVLEKSKQFLEKVFGSVDLVSTNSGDATSKTDKCSDMLFRGKDVAGNTSSDTPKKSHCFSCNN